MINAKDARKETIAARHEIIAKRERDVLRHFEHSIESAIKEGSMYVNVGNDRLDINFSDAEYDKIRRLLADNGYFFKHYYTSNFRIERVFVYWGEGGHELEYIEKLAEIEFRKQD